VTDVRTVQARSQVTGFYGGPVSRLAATALDAFLISTLYTAGLALITFALRTIVGVEVQADRVPGWLWALSMAGWAFVYLYSGLALAGRTPGKAVVGLRVVARDGAPLSSRRALIRVLGFPLSFLVFGLGLLGIIVDRERRALHDLLAGSAVVYDWGDRPAELPTPLSRFLAAQGATPGGEVVTGATEQIL
jgi:uncharacterized RDD family membrane protein YckC